MEKATPHLKIRVNLPEPQIETASDIKYRYHWNRIFTALFLVLGTVFLVIQASFVLLRFEPAATSPKTQAAVNDNHTTKFFENETIVEAELQLDAQTGQEFGLRDAPPPQPAPINKTTATPSLAMNMPSRMSAAPQSRTMTPLRPGETQIFSPLIKRFVLTDQVKNKEPVGAINNISPDTNNLLTIFAWSDTQGLKDQFLLYRWLHNGKEVAQIEIGVWSNRWRSYSRKYVTQNMRGQWLVELRTGKGDLLAQSTFQYK